MSVTSRWFPFEHLPPGFARSLDNPTHPPADPRPAASLVLLRRGEAGPETLLLRRSPRVGFIPGAFVFPGGRVDDEDGSPLLLARMSGLDAHLLSERMSLPHGEVPRGPGPPAHAFVAAALRETFEETGILLGRPPHGCRSHPMGGEPGGEIRASLLEGSLTFPEVVERLDVELAAEGLEYVGHWLTPIPEPRRYDTRFFAVEVTADCEALVDRHEMEEGLWITAAEALERNARGDLPLVYPTLRTLETLAEVTDPSAFLARHRGKPIPRVLPELRRGQGGIEIVVKGPDQVPA